MADAKEVGLTSFFGKGTVIYDQTYWEKYLHLVDGSTATGLKGWCILSPPGGSRISKIRRGAVLRNYFDQKCSCQMLNLRCEMCLLARPKNRRNDAFLQMELTSYSLPVGLYCEWDYYFNVIDPNTFEVIKLMWDIWRCRFWPCLFPRLSGGRGGGGEWGQKRLPWPWSAWPRARTASLHCQWDCCPKLFTLKIVVQCVCGVGGSDAYLTWCTHILNLIMKKISSWALLQLQQTSDEPHLPQRGPRGLQ